MKRLLTLVAFFATLQASAQQVNPVPDYVFRNQMSVGRGTVTDTAAYFSIGPRYGANKGFMPPIVGDTATFSSGKRNGLLIFSVQKNKFLYWDSVRVQWSDMAGSSGSYITGSGITGYLPQFSASTTLDTSALFTLGNRLGIGSSTFAYNSTNTANVELNGTAGGILGFKRNDSARGYLWHTGDNMELANTAAGSIFFNTNSATRGSISSAGVWRLHNLAGTGDRVVVASSNGTLSAASSATALVDTTTISTRAWRQKGLDSLAALEVSGSGTTNYIPKFTAGSTIGNSQIFDNGTNVGVATASPGYRLTISGPNTAGPVSALAIENPSTNSASEVRQEFRAGGTTWGYITNGYNSNSPFMAFGVSASSAAPTERLRITSGGDVGIGTTSPSAKLHIQGSEIRIQDNNSNINFRNAAGTRTGYIQSRADAFDIWNDQAVPMVFGTNNAERLRIFANGRVGINTTTDAGYQLDINGTLRSVNGANFATTSGNVGIGTASPAQKLDVAGITRVNGGTIYAQASGTESSGYQLNAITLGYDATNTIGWITAGGAAARTNLVLQQSGGNVGIGTASPANKLSINGAANALTYFLVDNSQTYLGDNGVIGGGAADGNTALSWFSTKDLYFKEGSSTRMTIKTGGNVGIGTASPLAVANYTGLTLSGTNGSFTSLYTGASQIARIEVNTTSDFTIKSIANVPLLFGTNNTENARFNTGGELLINTTTDAGDYKLQVAGNIYGSGLAVIGNAIINTNSPFVTGANIYTNGQSIAIGTQAANFFGFFTNNTQRAYISSAGEFIIDASASDAGDYKLQVVGNARVGTGKLDIVTNTAFGLSVSRSGTDVVAQQINNSTGILYYGAESSTGGGLFTGSSAYAAVIGSGAAYPLQFATDNVTRATINTNGELLINTLTDNGDFKLQVNGSALISGSIQTANPVSGTAVPWRLGSVVATNVQLDTGNYVEVNINGTFYRLAIVTPL